MKLIGQRLLLQLSTEARCVVVILTPSAKTSTWVGREIAYAETNNIPIIPLLGKGSESESVPIDLVRAQYIDIRDKKYDQGMKELFERLQNNLHIKPSVQADEEVAADSSSTEETVPSLGRDNTGLIAIIFFLVIFVIAGLIILPQLQQPATDTRTPQVVSNSYRPNYGNSHSVSHRNRCCRRN